MLVNLTVIRLGCRLPLQQRCLGPLLTNATVETVLFRIFTQISTCRENVFLSISHLHYLSWKLLLTQKHICRSCSWANLQLSVHLTVVKEELHSILPFYERVCKEADVFVLQQNWMLCSLGWWHRKSPSTMNFMLFYSLWSITFFHTFCHLLPECLFH